jgi:hypothetical protein
VATKIAAAKTVAIRTTKTIVTTTAEIMTKSRTIPEPTQKALDVYTEPSNTDVNGSYTGRPKNKKEVPVQDADDL